MAIVEGETAQESRAESNVVYRSVGDVDPDDLAAAGIERPQ
jgi:hypothetical protein